VLGHDGLGKVEAILDIPYRLLTVLQELQNPESIRVPDDFDDVCGLGQAHRIDGSNQSLLGHER
jgi:hypothetical protein